MTTFYRHGYLNTSKTKRSKGGKGSSKNTFIIKKASKGDGGLLTIGHTTIHFPKEMIGTRIKIRIEEQPETVLE